VTARNHFHIGILVNDMHAAIKHFSEVLGLTFNEPAIAHVDYFDQDGLGRSTLDLKICYSTEGPPYYELLETQPDGLYGRQHGEGMHHLGFWEPDCEARLKGLLEEHGMRWEASQLYTDARNKLIAAYTYPESLHGVRLEIVDEDRRPGMERWIQGGAWGE
jgi:catechol 2,3-dioxygenase-like lactoylglutathione lyase family enzyme